MQPTTQILDTFGELGCFTRPELKIERFSYPLITPSAARGIFDAIYCKPLKFRWAVTAIEVLAPPCYLALRRNEVKEKVSARAAMRWMEGKEEVSPILADGDKGLLGTDQRGRTQRQTMALKDVHYRLHAEVRPWPGFEGELIALEAQFRRRAARGQCHYQPYFGCREFPAYFTLVEGADMPAPAPVSLDVGLMLYDVFDLSRPGTATSPPAVSLFHAVVRDGVLTVPDYASDAVLKVTGGQSLC